MMGMDPNVRKDILEELKTHILDMVSELRISYDEAIHRMSPPRETAKTYKDLYGYGFGLKALFVAIAVLISIPSLPIFLPSSEAIEGPVWLSVVFFVIVTLYLIWVSVAAGRGVGLYSGIFACATRFVVLGLMLAFQSEAAVGGMTGIISFVISSLFLIGVGFLPGEA
ncbi:MAG: hypothetical protein ACE5IO_09025, partial [Thermoplasmata archaeon]